MSTPQILILAQEALRTNLLRILREHRVIAPFNARFAYNLAVLDAMMQDVPDALLLTADTHGKCAALESVHSKALCPPVLIISDDAHPESRRKLFAAGATDILIAPFEASELIFRLERLCNSRKMPYFGAWYLDVRDHTLHHKKSGAQQRLTQAEARALRCLLLASGRLVEHHELATVISPERESLGTVSVIVSRLRRHIATISDASFRIVSVRNRGYRIVGIAAVS